MEKLPTALELIRNKFPNHNGIFVLRNIEEFMIEFAQLHVKAALENAAEKAKTKKEYNFLGEEWNVDKQSILNSFDINDIK